MTSTKTHNPFELVTLMALLKHNVRTYLLLAVTHAVAEFTGTLLPDDPHRPFVPGMALPPDNIKMIMLLLRSEPAVIENRLIAKQIDRVLSILEKENSKPHELTTEIKNLYLRLDDFYTGQTFYIVSGDKVKNYEEPFAEWGSVRESFPSAMDAVEEAEKCFALGRNAACVFHCMAIMDSGLVALGRHLRTSVNRDTDTWEDIIGKVQGAINRKREAMERPAWKAVESFYEEALSDLRAVKNAWRNPTMHFRRVYTEEQAAKVRERVKDFMVHLSSHVHEPKRKSR